MKRMHIFSLLIIFVFLFNESAFCQDKGDIKSVLTNIIELSKGKKYDDAAKFVAYCADDKKKEYTLPQVKNKDQMNFVKRLLKRIGALAEVSTSFNVGAITEDNSGGNKIQKVSVEFFSGTQKINSSFKFVTLNGTLLLAEIE